MGAVKLGFANFSLASRNFREYKQEVSSASSGGNMTPPGLELHQN